MGAAWEGTFTYGQAVLLILGCYGLGCFTTAYYLVRLRTGKDIRDLGSGNAGARNATRVVGRVGGAMTLVGDAGKGAVSAWAASYFGFELWVMMAAMAAVVAGHIWPAQLGFRGGKGIATALGAVSVFDWWITAVLLVITGLGFGFLRRLTPSGLVAVSLAPIVVLALGQPTVVFVGIGLLATTVLFAHRTDIRSFIGHQKHGRQSG